jgi:hypothetical protein
VGLARRARSRWLQGLLVPVAIGAAYLPAMQAGFVWDDDAHVTANPYVVGPQGLADLWTSSEAVYYPLVSTSFWLIHALFGLDPFFYHLVNVLVHALCALALWRVLLLLEVPGAWLGSMLWALHPVQVESVAWITELKNTQSGLFFLLAVWFFIRASKAQPVPGGTSGTAGAMVLLFSVLALLSKTSTVILPAVLALCAWWLEGRWRWRILVRLAPLLLFSAAAGGWTIWEQQHHSGALGAEWEASLAQRLAIAGRVVWFYLAKLVWPDPLIFVYPRWEIDPARLASYLPAVAVVLAWLGAWWGRHGRARPIFLAYTYFLVALLPVMGFFDAYYFRYSFVADHFQYLASMGPLALAGAALARTRVGCSSRLPQRTGPAELRS